MLEFHSAPNSTTDLIATKTAVNINVYWTGLLGMLLTCLALAPSIGEAKTFKIATVSPDGLSWMKKLRTGVKEIAARTDDRVKFKIYPGGVQGDDFTVLRKMRIGQLHGGVVAASTLTRFYPDLQVYNLPLVFRNGEEVDYVRERMDKQIQDGLEAAGTRAVLCHDRGIARQMFANMACHLAAIAIIPATGTIADDQVDPFAFKISGIGRIDRAHPTSGNGHSSKAQKAPPKRGE